MRTVFSACCASPWLSTTPDVAYVGLNLWRVLEDRGLAQPLDGFLGDDPLAQGYTPAAAVAGPV